MVETKKSPKQCIRCFHKANFLCERCGAFYCSRYCQWIDWKKHKITCLSHMRCKILPPIKLKPKSSATEQKQNQIQKIDIPKGITKIQITDKVSIFVKTIPKDSRVFITNVIDHRSMYIRPSSDDVEAILLKLFDDLNEYGKLAKPIDDIPTPGTVMLAFVDDQSKYIENYRIVVLSAQSKNVKIDVFFLDFGNVGQLWLCQLRQINDDLKDRTIFINKISLQDVPAVQSNEFQLNFVKKVHESEMMLILKYDDSKTSNDVYLHFLFEPTTLNQKINRWNKINKSNDEKQSVIPELSMLVNYIPWDFVDGRNIEMYVINNQLQSDNQIVCVPVEKRKIFDKNMEAIQIYCKSAISVKSDVPFKPELQEMCLVPNQRNIYFRAFYVDRKGADALMVLLDYGQLKSVKFEHIRKMPKCLAFPVLSINCNVKADNTENGRSGIGCEVNDILKFDSVVVSSAKERCCDVYLQK